PSAKPAERQVARPIIFVSFARIPISTRIPEAKRRGTLARITGRSRTSQARPAGGAHSRQIPLHEGAGSGRDQASDLRAACRNRTDDLFITSEPLWPTELTRQRA